MSVRYLSVTLALVFLSACGSASSEGGIVGSGVSSVSGNVISVTVSSGGVAGAVSVPSVMVSLAEAPDISDTTDDHGNFALMGDFAGPITLVFADPQSGAEIGTLDLDVPAASSIVVQDIAVGQQVEAAAVRQFGFFGRVLNVDCSANAAGILLVDDEASAAPHQFLVRLLVNAVIVRRNGRAATCADVAAGDQIAVDGFVRRGVPGITAALMVIAPGKQPKEPPATRTLTVDGTVEAINCAEGMIVHVDLDEDSFDQRVHFQTSTLFIDETGHAIRCNGVAAGDAVKIDGQLPIAQPGAVNAVRVTITQVVDD